MNLFPLIRDARCAELNLLDFLEAHQGEDLKNVLANIAKIMGSIADDLEKFKIADDDTRKDALRWQALYGTAGVRLRKVGTGFQLVQDDIDVFGRPSGCRLLAIGSSEVDVVDRWLGFIK